MRLYELVFSPTGGTQRVVDLLKEGFPGSWERIDLLKAGVSLECTPEDVCLVAVPSYGGRVPAPAVERLAALRGNGARAVLVCVYGNRAWEDTLLELKDTLSLAGFGPVAAVAAVAEHSIMRQYGTGRPDAADAEELRRFGGEIRQHLESGTGGSSEGLPAEMPGNLQQVHSLHPDHPQNDPAGGTPEGTAFGSELSPHDQRCSRYRGGL